MRRVWFVPMVFAVCACGEDVRHSFKPPLEGQSPPEPVKPAQPVVQEPVNPNSAYADSPTWLRSNAPVEWTVPPGWEAELSTRPMRLVEFTLEKNGPGGAPIQLAILSGADDHPAAKQASLDRWEVFFHEDVPRISVPSEHDGLKVTKFKVHGSYEGPPLIGSSETVNEPNWSMICGWVEGPNGSIMFKVLGPDAIIKAAEPKIDQLLASMKPRERKQQ